MKRICMTLMAIASLLLPLAAAAQGGYPGKPIRMILKTAVDRL